MDQTEQQDKPITPTATGFRGTSWLPVVGLLIPLVTFAAGLLGGYVASQIRISHLEWSDADHERRIISLERESAEYGRGLSVVNAKLDILGDTFGRNLRGVKAPGP